MSKCADCKDITTELRHCKQCSMKLCVRCARVHTNRGHVIQNLA